MRQKEVIGQSMRTTKSARPGSVVYVPMDKSEFRSIIFSEKKKNKIKKIVILIILMIFLEKSGWRRDNPELCSECYLFENHICRKIQGKIWYFSRIQYENGLRGMKQGFN
ncbi:hypothetical protein [Blautia obeum]|uniref:hypothetical protein n=1 Tax=Blautia obeum TaxID=40520 RepID=UPI00156E967F|nr:hypothetical protein [Blautia obeum]NSJ36544.1 hypothetical protein [Blautia obeum]